MIILGKLLCQPRLLFHFLWMINIIGIITPLPDEFLNDRSLYWLRGKVLGGSSSLNAMVYIQGNAKDFDRWHLEGAQGWDYRSICPYFKRSKVIVKGVMNIVVIAAL